MYLLGVHAVAVVAVLWALHQRAQLREWQESLPAPDPRAGRWLTCKVRLDPGHGRWAPRVEAEPAEEIES